MFFELCWVRLVSETDNSNSLLGYTWVGGEWWDGMEWSGMKPHSIVWFCKKWMEWNGVGWNAFHPIPLIPSIFHSTQFGVYPMEWNTLIIKLPFCHHFFLISLFIPSPHQYILSWHKCPCFHFFPHW